MFRRVGLPSAVEGSLYLYSMPGRSEHFDQVIDEFEREGISQVISLAPMHEIESNSPDYARAIRSSSVPALVTIVPVEDFDVPSDREGFDRVARSAAQALRSGKSILVHCGAGIGRTGMFAALVLHHLGTDLQEALDRLDEAGSRPERDGQTRFLRGMVKGERSKGSRDQSGEDRL